MELLKSDPFLPEYAISTTVLRQYSVTTHGYSVLNHGLLDGSCRLPSNSEHGIDPELFSHYYQVGHGAIKQVSVNESTGYKH